MTDWPVMECCRGGSFPPLARRDLDEAHGAHLDAGIATRDARRFHDYVRPLSLSLATFTGAAEQAGLSRRLGGIHFRDADMAGREPGRRVAQAVRMKALASFGQGA
jgi:hypothetical protein